MIRKNKHLGSSFDDFLKEEGILMLESSINADAFFQKMDEKYTQAGALLRGTRHREGLSQIEFAKKLGITQGDLSKMENGKRAIGKVIAKRIQKKFAVNYRYFLE